MTPCTPRSRATASYNGYSHLAHLRQQFVRCDAHWHRPKRADWRAKAYARSAQWTCAAAPVEFRFAYERQFYAAHAHGATSPRGDGPFCSLHWDAVHPARVLQVSGRCVP